MKELSIEEKAKRYDEAIKRARKIHNETEFDYEKGMMEEIFPELKENEDEKIRKEMINFMSSQLKSLMPPCPSNETLKKWIAWLEKQGKQKDSVVDFKAKDWYVSKVDGKIRNIYHSVDRVEPKFHEGDMIIHKELGGDYIHNPHKIIQVDILDKKYRLEGGLVAHFGEQDDYELVEQTPTWSEEDEKMLNDAIGAIGAADYYTYDDKQEIENWLKSLKERYTWNPSDEQMDALETATSSLQSTTLESLYNELKKL